ncbi:MAG: amidinotransferase [Proteobacteria bacterium]|nr:amidinotransferase [Pseudomonadota bacterium]
MMRPGVHYEWGRLCEAVVGTAPADDIVVFHEDSQRWLEPAAAEFSRAHAGRRLVDVDAEFARRIELQIEGLAALLQREGVTVHRPERLREAERQFLAPLGEGLQLLARDPLIVVGNHAIEGSLRLQCRQRERFGLRAIVQRLAAAGMRWSSVPLGSPGAVDGPFLEGGDVLLNGHEVYVGMSGCASDLAGADWLQALVGPAYRVIPVALRSNVLHLDWALTLVRPGLLLHCPEKLIDGLPMSLRAWDKVVLSPAEAEQLQVNILALDENRAVVEAGNERIIAELRRRRIETIPLPFDAARLFGGGLRSACAPLSREGAVA